MQLMKKLMVTCLMLIDSNPHMKYLINAPKELPAVYFFYSFGSPVQGIVWY